MTESTSLNRPIWLTWEKQPRNRSMSKVIDFDLYEIISQKKGFLRYFHCIIQTVKIIQLTKPKYVICQNPSLILTSLMIILRGFYKYRIIIDAHFGGVEAFNGSKMLQKILDSCNKAANLVIVTNEVHLKYVRKIGGRSFVFPDPIPEFSDLWLEVKVIPGKVFFICSYDVDEPYYEVFTAAEILSSEGLYFFASGDYGKASINPKDWPFVKFLGFVPEYEYYWHLLTAQLVIDLTDHENCLVCGAYEAIGAGKPIILSKKKALQKYFLMGTVFTENTAVEIAAAVKDAYLRRMTLQEEGYRWVQLEKEQMKNRVVEFNNLIRSI